MIARVLVGLLVIWLVFVVVGVLFKTLLWLAVVGIVLLVGTAVYGAVRRRSSGQLR